MNESALPLATASATLRTSVKGLVSLVSRLARVFAWPRSIRSTASRELAVRNLAFAEKEFSIQHPLHLRVRADRVYDTGRSLILLELKTRLNRKIYRDDIIEMSAQRLAVRHSTGRDVSRHGYVLLVHPLLRSRSLHRVELLADIEVVRLAQRRLHILAGRVAPNEPPCKTRCARCEYRSECQALSVNCSESNII